MYSKGCYGDGEFVLAGRDSWLTLDTSQMMEDETYVVFVVIRKGGRIAHQYQVVEVIQGDPPVSKIELVKSFCLTLTFPKHFYIKWF